MKKQNKYHLDITIDKLTNSILNTISGDSFPTDVHPVTKADLKTVTKKNGWLFTWATELKFSDRHVFKLTIRDNRILFKVLRVLAIIKIIIICTS